jgi:Nif-specific regulatory protein
MPEVMNLFMDYEWPGNVRELENTIERLVVMSGNNIINVSDLPQNIKDQRLRSKALSMSKDALPSAIADIEKIKILDALKSTGWVQAKAARILGITPRQIGYKMKRYAITEKEQL